MLKNYRRQAHAFGKMGDERAVCSRVRCVALTRIIFGDSHWKLAQAYSKLAQAYLEQRGKNWGSSNVENVEMGVYTIYTIVFIRGNATHFSRY